MDGNVITIKGDVCRAVVLKDRSTILVLERDGLLYSTTAANLEEKTTIAENATAINHVTSSGILYQNADLEIVRYFFADGSTISLGKNLAATHADNTLSILFANEKGNIYLLPEDAAEPEKISHYDTDFYAKDVSDDGKTALWVEKDSSAGTHTIYCYTNGNRTKLEEVNYKYDYSYVQFNKSQTFLGVADIYSQKVHILTLGGEESKEFTTVKLGNDIYSSTLYTKNGILSNETSDTIDGLYAMVDADSNFNVYYIANGDREKVLSNISKMDIAGGRIYYINEDGNLNTAKLNGSELVEENKVSSDVETFRISSDGNYVYYFKNSDNNAGLLSRYSVLTGESEKISSNVYNYSSTYYTSTDFYLSTDGKTVYYFEDVEENIGGTYSDMGTLKYATVGSDPVKIATDIIVSIPMDGLDSNYINPTSFTVTKYISVEEVDDTDQLVVNWIYFNGTEATVIAKDVYNNAAALSTTIDK